MAAIKVKSNLQRNRHKLSSSDINQTSFSEGEIFIRFQRIFSERAFKCYIGMVKKFIISLLIFTGIFFISFKSLSAINQQDIGRDTLTSEQLVIVITNNWNDVQARLFCFEKINGKWQRKFNFPAVVGIKGMALGNGFRTLVLDGAPIKKEGDLKSPAGIFELGPAFGYAGKGEVGWMNFDYIRASDTLFCIDDSSSAYYNQLVKTNTLKADWHSFEEMHRKDNAYKWGLFVQHNTDPVKSGKGSCIFLHIWDNSVDGTAGCTAMREDDLLNLLHWIRSDKHPLLVQLPLTYFRMVSSIYNLPSL
jgi:L,D-peptidoglycan transpeptidase YkuD (ErfK/YbiS/YcfS/YnhG family)